MKVDLRNYHCWGGCCTGVQKNHVEKLNLYVGARLDIENTPNPSSLQGFVPSYYQVLHVFFIVHHGSVPSRLPLVSAPSPTRLLLARQGFLRS